MTLIRRNETKTKEITESYIHYRLQGKNISKEKRKEKQMHKLKPRPKQKKTWRQTDWEEKNSFCYQFMYPKQHTEIVQNHLKDILNSEYSLNKNLFFPFN